MLVCFYFHNAVWYGEFTNAIVIFDKALNLQMLLHCFAFMLIFIFVEMAGSFYVNRMLGNHWLYKPNLKLAVIGNEANELEPIKQNSIPTRIDKKSQLNAHIELLINIWTSVCLASQEQGWMQNENEEDEYIDFVLSDYYGDGTSSVENDSGRIRKRASGVIQNFQFCKDTCAADNVFLMATQNDEGKDVLRLSRVRIHCCFFSNLSSNTGV